MEIEISNTSSHAEVEIIDLESIREEAKAFCKRSEDFGRKLAYIRDNELHRSWGFSSFKAFCEDIGIAKSTAYRLVALHTERPQRALNSTTESLNLSQWDSQESETAPEAPTEAALVPEEDVIEFLRLCWQILPIAETPEASARRRATLDSIQDREVQAHNLERTSKMLLAAAHYLRSRST